MIRLSYINTLHTTGGLELLLLLLRWWRLILLHILEHLGGAVWAERQTCSGGKGEGGGEGGGGCA